MPDVKLKTRIQNKYKTLDEWNTLQETEFIPLKGEICYAYVDDDIIYQKIGDGETDFVNLPWLVLSTKDTNENGIFYIEGTGNTEGVWLGSHSAITEYYPGLKIAYKVGIAGSSDGSTLNINNLGAVAVVRNVSSAITTHFGVNSVIDLTYTIDTAEGVSTPYWKLVDYDSDTKTRSSNKTGSKMYIIGATTQSTSGQTTYSNKNCYIGTDNRLYSNGEQVYPRIYTSLIPLGTNIGENADLNTLDYLKVGNYYCSANATVKTLTNCPITVAFMMQVYSPLATTIDNETTKTWAYRTRKIITYTGEEYIQSCNSGSTAGEWTYKPWQKVVSTSEAAIPVKEGGTGQTSITDTTYTTARYRASALVSSETSPTTNGVINWVYE